MAIRNANEKLHDSKDFPKIIEVTDPKAVMRYGGTKMLIAPPIEYDAFMKKIPYGKLVTADYIRNCLAKQHGADYTCPLTAGIFMNIAAQASYERDVDETPYWRTLRTGGELNEKYPGGIEEHKALLEKEGHTIIQKGKKYFVKDYENKLHSL